MMDALLLDLRYALRTLRASPGFTLVALLTIALGIGATTAIFSVVNTVLLRPLPYPEPDRLVLIQSDLRARNVTDFAFPPGDLPDLREQGTMLESVAALVTNRVPATTDEGQPEQVPMAFVTPNLLSLLGGRPVLGRGFVDADGTPIPPPAAQPAQQGPPPAPPPTIAVLSHGYWQRRYGGDPTVVGRVIRSGNVTAEIVGVLGPDFELLFPPANGIERRPDVYVPLRIDFASASRINVFLRVVARLKPGATQHQAQAQIDGIVGGLRERFPIKETADLKWRVEPMHLDLVADVRPGILALMGAVVFVLLIACANVANLLLVRAAARERELAVRAALGAGRGDLVRQMLTESALLAGAGAAAGVVLALIGLDLLRAIAPRELPRIDDVSIDLSVLAFTVVTALGAAVTFGLVPALRASRHHALGALRSSSRTAGLAAGRRLRNAVVVAEVVLAFVLLIGSGLMIRSFVALVRTDPGFDPDRVLTFVLQPQGLGLNSDTLRANWVRETRRRLAALPGITGVTAAAPLPLDGGVSNARWGTEEAQADPTKFQQANVHAVLPGYFELMKTRLLEGRAFTEHDNAPTKAFIVVDRVLALKAFPGRSAVGQRLYVRVRSNEPEWLDIIGVVEHQRHASLATDGRETIFVTDGFFGHGVAQRWAVRTAGNPALLGSTVRSEVARFAPTVPVAQLQPMRAFVVAAMAPTRFALLLLGVFAVIAAILAAVGLYGVLSTAVRQRTAEIGVRMTFGAAPGTIFRLIIAQGLRLSTLGVGGGLVAALLLTRVMRSLLVGVRPTDPATFLAIALLFLAVAAFASWLPARQATRVDPMVALRTE
jgi:putative ABC transport system permease protein